MSQPIDIRQMDLTQLQQEYHAARAMLFSTQRPGIDRKIELRNIIGKCSQELLLRKQRGELNESSS